MKPHVLAPVLACLLAAPALAQPGLGADPARLSAYVKVLASDAFEGRGPDTRAEPKVIDYLSRQFAALGLQPGGDNGGWTQAVPLNRFEVTGPVQMAFKAAGWSRPLVQAEDATVWTLRPVDRVEIENAPLVFVGYGVSAPERHWDDFKGYDLHGKIAVVLVNDPDFEVPGSTHFDGKAMTYYGRWTYKYEEAARRGALGVLIVHETPAAGYEWSVVKNSNTGPQFDIVRADPAREQVLLRGWIQRPIAVELFRHAGVDFEALKRAAQREDFRPVPLTGASFSADFAVNHGQVITHNVLGRLPGAARPNETVMYSAHWDHLGIGVPDASGDRIYHGAADDGTGLAGLFELARLFAAAPRTQRSIVFAAWTAEEKNLLGSEYYARHPLYPLATTVADFNMDVLQTAGPAHDVVLVGAGKDTLETNLRAAAAREGRTVTPDAHPEVGSFYRGDQFSLAKVGVPVLPLMALGGGPDLVNGGKAAGEAWVNDYTAHRYHRPADKWDPHWDLRGAAEDVDLIYTVGRDLANSDAWPSWNPGSEFAAARQATASARR